jgi:ubiquitin-conjugating enzyme (huntingtin interacting protein 2)
MISIGRIKKELKEVTDAKDAGIEAHLINGDWSHWQGSITGPSDSPYEGGVFQVDIKIPEQYPFEPPKMKLYFFHFWGILLIYSFYLKV